MRIGNVLTIVLTITIALATPASAQVDAMWDGSTLDTFWLTGDNWTGGIAPNAALDIARFDDTGVMGVVDMNGNALTVFDMYLSGAASGYDISNGTLTATNVYHSATGTNTISGAVSLGGIGVFTVSGGRLNLTNPASSITGLTLITGGALDIGDLSVNSNILAGSFIKFQLASEESGGIVIARGTGANKFARNIGSADGDVRWYANGGGFAARGGPLELLLEGGRLLDWGSSSYGFGRKTIAFGHAVADDVVTLLNDVEVDRDCNVIVFDNHDTDTDIAELRGTLVPPTIVGKWLIKRATENDAAAYAQSGTLWLSNAANTYDNTRIQGGAIRLSQDDDGLGTGYVQFYADRHDQPAVLESKGTFDRTIGTALGQIHWATDLSLDATGEGRGGGCAAYGGPLTVTLHPNNAPGTTNLVWD
ncbi:MAG: hypothetical protein QGH60_21830, partial [Phycisphaerae bacterium]|nr:hypothetical protein [Phycisphaerae bacterium]